MDVIRGTAREEFPRANPHDNFDIVSRTYKTFKISKFELFKIENVSLTI